jgi:phage shock protein PspC (stress-responsive transcriptional regulator)
MDHDDLTSGATAPTPPPPPSAGPTTEPPPYGGPTTQASAPGARPQDRFFDGIRRTGLHRSQHRVIGGVSGGIAERTGIDVTVVRVLAVVLAVFGGVGILAYGLAWLLLPEPDGRIHGEQVLRGDVSAGAVGAIVTTVLSFGGFWNHGPGWGLGGGGLFGWFWGVSGTALFIGVVALVIYAVSQGRNRPTPGGWPPAGPGPSSPPPAAPSGWATSTAAGTAPAPVSMPAPTPGPMSGPMSGPMPGPVPGQMPAPNPPTPPRRPTFGGFGALAVAGLAAIGAGITALVMSNGSYDASTGTMAWAVALAVVSACLVAGGILGRRAGIVGLLAVVVALGTLVSAVIPKMSHVQSVGDRTWRPILSSTASNGYGLGAGNAVLDLTGLDTTGLSQDSPVHVPVSVGFGQLKVRVPDDVAVEVKASAGAGDLVAVDGLGVVEDSVDRGSFLGDDDDHGDVNGIGVHRTSFLGNGPVLVVVDAKVGFGQLQIEQVP